MIASSSHTSNAPKLELSVGSVTSSTVISIGGESPPSLHLTPALTALANLLIWVFSYILNVERVLVVRVELLVEPGILVHVGVVVLKYCHSYSIVAVELPAKSVAVVVEVILPAITSPAHIVVDAAVAMSPGSPISGT